MFESAILAALLCNFGCSMPTNLDDTERMLVQFESKLEAAPSPSVQKAVDLLRNRVDSLGMQDLADQFASA